MPNQTHKPQRVTSALICSRSASLLVILLSMVLFACGGGDSLPVDQHLIANQSLQSPNRLFRFVFQGDGNLVLQNIQTGKTLWAANTQNKSASYLVLQSDGNLVLYSAATKALWASNTVGSGATRLVVQNDGTLALLQGTSSVWSVDENTGGGTTGGGTTGGGTTGGGTTGGGTTGGTFFTWGTKQVHYKYVGGLASGVTKSTPAKASDYEIVSFGASHGGGEGLVNIYFDKAKMESQGFKGLIVRGMEDRKAEMWVRKNSGQSSISIPSAAVAYTFLILDGNDIQLNLGNTTTNNVFASGSPYKVPSLAGSGLKILTYFSDDWCVMGNVGNGKMLWQSIDRFGDGDAFHTVLYAPGKALPSTIPVDYKEGGGRQYVGILANFNQ